jgi:hypothetical protein
MARAPRAKVSKTSGQGVSRLSYQRGYSLANKADAPSVSGMDMGEGGGGRSGRQYAKSGAGKMNVDYGESHPIGTLDDVNAVAKDKPGKGLDLTLKKAKKLK